MIPTGIFRRLRTNAVAMKILQAKFYEAALRLQRPSSLAVTKLALRARINYSLTRTKRGERYRAFGPPYRHFDNITVPCPTLDDETASCYRGSLPQARMTFLAAVTGNILDNVGSNVCGNSVYTVWVTGSVEVTLTRLIRMAIIVDVHTSNTCLNKVSFTKV